MATMKLRRPRRAFAAALAGTTGLAIVLAGCAGDAGTGSEAEGDISGDLKILVSSADASDAAFRQVNEAFAEKYPDVDIDFATVPNDTYPQSQSSRLTAGNVDIVVVKNLVEVPDYAKDSESTDAQLAAAGGYVDLTDEPFMSNYNSTVLDAQAFDGKQYAVPTGLSYSTGVYYNKSIFEDLGLSVPTTWDELMTVAESIKDSGAAPFGIGGKDGWPAGLAMLGAANGVYPTLEDKQEAAAAIWDGSLALTDAGPVSVLEKTQQIFDYAQPNFAGSGYTDIPALFASGAVAMTPDGTWNEPTIAAAVDGAFEYGYFPLPASDDATDNASLNGKVELQLGVPASTKNKAAALAWLEFFSEPTNYQSFVKTSGFSPSQPDIAVSEFLDSITDYTADFELAWEQTWTPNAKAGQAATFPFNYADLAPLGTLDAAGAAAAAADAWVTP